MNKILEFIRKHSKITVILIILCSLLPLIIVHILFKWNSGIAFLVAEWSAGELLGYIGTLLSFWGTIILGWLALQASNKANELSRRVIELEQDHYRLEMRPFVLVSNWKAYEVDSRELVNDPKKKFIQIGSHKGEKVLGLSIELTNTTESVITVQYNCGTARTRDLCWGNAAVNQENLKMTLSPGEKDEFVFYASSNFMEKQVGQRISIELILENRFSKRYKELFTIIITSSEKVVWLDSYEDLKNGNYDVIFKSAKYNHVRNEIDTETMQERGRRKRPQDGDEEKTHLCIRLAKGENRFLAVHESNHYGITLKCIIDYLNEQFKKFNEDGNDPYHYTIESQIMPGEDFLSSIKRAKTMSVLKLTVYKDDIKDGFMRFAGRTDIADEVDICLKRPKGYKCFPENLIKEYFKDSQDKAKGKIKRIKIIGTNDAGSFEVDTNITGMKHFLKVKGESVTNEVESSDFFVKAQEFIASMGGRI